MNLRILRFLMMVAGIAALLTSCRTDDLLDLTAGRGEALQINVTAAGFTSHGFGMRTDDAGYTTAFAAGDRIGITVVKDNTIILHDNIPYEYNGSAWNPVNVTDTVRRYFEADIDYLVYYPYDATMAGKTTASAVVAAFTPQADQSARAAYTASDLMTGTGALNGTALTVTLTHALSLIELNFSAEASSILFGIDGGGTLTPYFFEGVFRFIAKPQDLPVELAGSFTIGNKTMLWQQAEVTLAPGKYNRLNIFVPSLIEGYTGNVQVFYTDGSDETATIASAGFLKLKYGAGKTLMKIVLLDKSNKEYYIGRTTDRPLCLKFDANGNLLFRPAENGYIPIGSYAEFQKIHDDVNTRAGNYRQEADLDLMNVPWTPVGSSNSVNYHFKGTYDGNNKTISRLTVNYTGVNYSGLFGYVDGKIQNVSITEANITGKDNVGGIAGYSTGIITNCNTGGKVTGANYVGGIAGYVMNGGTIVRCQNYGEITGTTEIGGIAGRVDALGSTVEACYNSGAIKGGGKVGGIAGLVFNFGSAIACKNSGPVSGTANMVGGVAGEAYNSGVVRNCYSTGAVTGPNDVGGVVGCVTSGSNGTGLAEYCYATGVVNGVNSVGGVAGLANSGSTVRNCVALNPTVRASDKNIGRAVYMSGGNLLHLLALETISSGGGIPFSNGINTSHNHMDGKSITSAQAMMRATYETYVDSDLPDPLGWDFTDVWTINEGNGYPTLQWE